MDTFSIAIFLFSFTLRVYLVMYLSPECPNIDEISTGLTFCRTKIVANVCLAQWKVIGYARKSRQKKIKRKPFEMSIVSVFCQIEKMQMTT